MRRRHRFSRVGLALFLIPVFLSTALLYGMAPADAAPAKSSPPTQQPAPSQSTTISGTDPLGVPEDPLGRQSEQQAPEISIGVDVRDGHLIVRGVDIWGPGRVPLVTRSWTGVGGSPSGAGYWQFNHHLNASAGSASATVLEPDGNISTYRFLQQIGTGASRTWVYAKDVGSYGRFEAPVTCESCNGEFGCGPTICYLASGGAYTVYLPKGMIHRYSRGLLS